MKVYLSITLQLILKYMRFAVADILKLAGIENPSEVVGKTSINIGGLEIYKLDKVINLQEEKTVVVNVGGEIKKIELPAEQTEDQKKNVDDLKKADGEHVTKLSKKLQEEKKKNAEEKKTEVK